MLEVTQLDTYHGQIHVLKSIQLFVNTSEIVAVIGSNGAGKSTLLGTLAGLYPPANGEIRLAGKSIKGLPAYRVVRQGLSLVPEGRQIFHNLTVKDNLILGMFSQYYADRGKLNTNLERMLELFPGLKKNI